MLCIGLSLSVGCQNPVDRPLDTAACDDSIQAAAVLPPMLAAERVSAVGSGDTWFIAPSGGTWSQDVRWDGQAYFLKIAIWTLQSEPPTVIVRQVRGAANGSAAFFPTTAGLPGPLPTQVRFPTVGCWELTARGLTGSATARVGFDQSARTR